MPPDAAAPSLDLPAEGPPRKTGGATVRPKSAATLLLIRRDGPHPRVLMGRRHPKDSFMPARWVFPGGRLDRADHRAPFASDLEPEARAAFDRHLKPGRGRALALAAVRETWEETGLMLAQAAPVRPGVGPWREFLAQGALADLAPLQVVARAVTPPMIAKRFDAWFLLAPAERLLSLEPQSGCGELDEIAWVSLDEALDLPLPHITRLLLTDVFEDLDAPDRPRPYVRHHAGAMRRFSL